ncbi:MAG: RidA family protein [Alphaproteobacteria bacterium]|nr:RidA family protein [Alphaproteobacteria bacterium]
MALRPAGSGRRRCRGCRTGGLSPGASPRGGRHGKLRQRPRHGTANQGGRAMNRAHNPAGMPPAASRYSQAIEAEAGSRLIVVSGQVGNDAAGKVAQGIEAQCELAFRNIETALKAGGMALGDVIRFNSYVTDPRYIATFREVRDRMVKADPPATSTLVVVAGLAGPDMLVEIEAIAAKK